jgi:hypothetical protein
LSQKRQFILIAAFATAWICRSWRIRFELEENGFWQVRQGYCRAGAVDAAAGGRLVGSVMTASEGEVMS